MKVKVVVAKYEEAEIEIEAENPVFEKLDNYWRTTDFPMCKHYGPMVNEAVKALETKMGLSCGDKSSAETIVGVYAMDGQAILEW